MPSARAAEKVFLNIPYDKSAEQSFLAYVAGLTTLGFAPRAALDIPGGERRLDRILELIQECRYSVHELSPIQVPAKRPQNPRLNMAFELGLAVALDRASPHHHTWFVFCDRRTSLDGSLSDLGGTDAHFHRRRVSGIFRELANAFVREERQPTVQDMDRVYRALNAAVPGLKRDAGARSVFTARVFRDLRMLSGELGEREKRG